MAPTRWGIASAGAICHDFVNAVEVLPDSENHKIVAVAAREEESAKKFAQDFGIAKYYGGYEKLAKDPDVEV
jgi:dihydrodiol dehydrogenase / D-xylose 1-dehydrogenase (NADP)